jgi:hypothetical protein
VEELQIDWLSSEDLKEEKVVSAPKGDYKPFRLILPKFRASNHAIGACSTAQTRAPSDEQPLLRVKFDWDQNKRQTRERFRLILLTAAGLRASAYFIAVTCLPSRDL